MGENSVDIGWESARESNRENWDDRVPLHEEAYAVGALDDPNYLTSIVQDDLAALTTYLPDGNVIGLDVCHLQCHIGTDTLSFARAGAQVTGVDFSGAALASARRLASRLSLQATWVETDVLKARAAIEGDFDLVYTSIGTITWLPDLDRWAQQVAELLRPGGTFFIRDGHPALYSLDESADDLRIGYSYFGNGDAQQWDEASTYVGDGTVAHTRTYEWPHPISEVINALIGAGLRIVRMDEGRVLPWQFSPRMVEVKDGFAWPEDERDRVPCTYTIIALRD